MRGNAMRRRPRTAVVSGITLLGAFAVAVVMAGTLEAGSSPKANGPVFKDAVASDLSKPLSELAKAAPTTKAPPRQHPRGAAVDRNLAIEGGASSQSSIRPEAVTAGGAGMQAAAIAAPLANFEGLSNQDNFNVFGFRVNPPDPSATWARTTTSR